MSPRQPLLLPVDLREWVPADDLSHFVLEAAGRVPRDRFQVNRRGSGSAQYHPQMMLALQIYSYANGLFGSRRIERATYRDIGMRYFTADKHPDHDTICKFRRENSTAVAERFPCYTFGLVNQFIRQPVLGCPPNEIARYTLRLIPEAR